LFPFVDTLPDFADISDPCQKLNKGRPVLTFFARAGSVAKCLAKLWVSAEYLDRLV